MKIDKAKIQEYIKKAKEIDISSIDVNNIDVDAIKTFLLEKKEIVICVFAVLLGLWGGYFLFNKNVSEAKLLKEELKGLEEKLSPADQFVVKRKKLKKFFEDFPEELADSAIVTEITNLATKHGFVISNYSPAVEKNQGFFIVSTVQIDGQVSSYLNLVKFIRDVETSQYALRIDSMQVQAIEDKKDGQKNETSFKITLRISAITLIENDKKKTKK